MKVKVDLEDIFKNGNDPRRPYHVSRKDTG